MATWVRQFGPALLGTTPADLYVVGGSTTARVLHMHWSNPSQRTVKVWLSIGNEADGTLLFREFTLPPNSVYPHDCYHVLGTGQKIQGHASVANTVVFTFSGEETSS